MTAASSSSATAVGIAAEGSPRAGRPGGAPAPLHVEVVRDYAVFLNLESVWNRLADRAQLDHPFLEHIWVRSWWECFGQGSHMHILVVKEGGEAVAIAPLVLTRTRMFGIPLRRLGSFYNDHVPRSGFIVADRSPEVHAAIWKHLSEDSCWDVLQLCQLAEDSETLAAVRESGARVETWISGECPYVPVRAAEAGEWSKYLASLPVKHRANLRNRAKRLAARGEASVETIDSSVGLRDALEDGLRLEAAAWKGEAGTAISCEPALARFYWLIAQRAAARGWLRLNFLKSADQRIAFDYSLCYKNRTYLLKHGYDPAHSQFSPSQLLLESAIETAFAQDQEEYEILGDNAEWKRNWTSRAKKHFWVFAFSRGWRARAVHAAKFRVVPFVKQNHVLQAAHDFLDHARKRILNRRSRREN